MAASMTIPKTPDVRECTKDKAPGFFEDLNTFIQEVAPVVKRKKDRLEPLLKEHAKICGWHYCLVEGCGKNRSADLLMTWIEVLEHLKGHGLNTPEMIEAATKQIQIRIKVEGTCECNEDADMEQLRTSFADLHLDGNMKQPVADSIMNTIVQLVLKSIWHAELGAFPEDSEIEQGSDNTEPEHGFVCLLKNCGIILLSKDYRFAPEWLSHMADKHPEENDETLILNFFYSDSTDIDEPDLTLKCIKCGCISKLMRTDKCGTHAKEKLTKKGFVCSLCALQMYDRLKNMKDRFDGWENKDKSEYPSICPRCQESFNFWNHLKNFHHISRGTATDTDGGKNKAYKCSVCDLIIYKVQDVILHLAMIEHASNVMTYI